MSTTTEAATTALPPPTTPREAGADQWVCVPATWEIYTALLDARGERARPRYTFIVLGADGRYAVSPVSACFPSLGSDDLSPWLYRKDLPSETRVWALFRAWVEGTLVPRQRPVDQV